MAPYELEHPNGAIYVDARPTGLQHRAFAFSGEDFSPFCLVESE